MEGWRSHTALGAHEPPSMLEPWVLRYTAVAKIWLCLSLTSNAM
jgi:hypothetical protein